MPTQLERAAGLKLTIIPPLRNVFRPSVKLHSLQEAVSMIVYYCLLRRHRYQGRGPTVKLNSAYFPPRDANQRRINSVLHRIPFLSY